jgi:nucleotide-binding universal stress UspA family protein
MNTSDTSYQKILVAVDGSDTSILAANYAISLAEKYKAQLIILNVLHLHTLRQISSSFITAPTFGLEQVKKIEEEAKRSVDDIRKKADQKGLVSKTKIIEESTSIVGSIVEFAENERVDLIVVGTRGRTGFRRMLLGSVAKGVVTYAHCQVLVVK